MDFEKQASDLTVGMFWSHEQPQRKDLVDAITQALRAAYLAGKEEMREEAGEAVRSAGLAKAQEIHDEATVPLTVPPLKKYDASDCYAASCNTVAAIEGAIRSLPLSDPSQVKKEKV